MKLTSMKVQTRGVVAELIVELDGIHFEAIRIGVGTEAPDVAARLRALAARIEHRAANGVQGTAADQFCDSYCTWADHHPDCPRAAGVAPSAGGQP